MGRYIPSWKQFSSWSLPSKASVIGLPIALVALAATLWPRTYLVPAHLVADAVRANQASTFESAWTGSYEFAAGERRRFDVLEGFDPGPGPGGLRDFFFASGSPLGHIHAGAFVDSVGPVYEFAADDSTGQGYTYTFAFTVGWRGTTSTRQHDVSIVVGPSRSDTLR